MIFDLYCRYLFRRRFRNADFRVHYKPVPGSRTIFFLNHHSWWDALIPIYMNQRYFGQRARGMMLEEQLRKYPFFRKLGVFSIRKGDPASAIRSLRYSMQSLSEPDNGIYIFPEGGIHPFRMDDWAFEPGLAWLVQKCLAGAGAGAGARGRTDTGCGARGRTDAGGGGWREKSPGGYPAKEKQKEKSPGGNHANPIHPHMVDVVPVGVFTHTMWDSKPDLHITVGEPLSIPERVLADRTTLTSFLSSALTRVVEASVNRALQDPSNRDAAHRHRTSGDQISAGGADHGISDRPASARHQPDVKKPKGGMA